MKEVHLKTVSYCPPECVVLRLTQSANFMQLSEPLESETIEVYNDKGYDTSNWN